MTSSIEHLSDLRDMPMSKRIRLTAGGAKVVAEWKRYVCPHCASSLLIHPTRLLPHLQECLKDISMERKFLLYEKVQDLEMKTCFASLLLQEHSPKVVH